MAQNKPPKKLKKAKRIEVDSAAAERGIIKERLKSQETMLKKHPLLFLQSIIEKHGKDIPEWAAMAAMTILVKSAIDSSEELTTAMVKTLTGMGKFIVPQGYEAEKSGKRDIR